MNIGELGRDTLYHWEGLSSFKKHIIAWPLIATLGLGGHHLRNFIYTTEEDKRVDACLSQVDDSREQALQCLAEGFNKICFSDEKKSGKFWYYRDGYREAAISLKGEEEEMDWWCSSMYEKAPGRYHYPPPFEAPLSKTEGPGQNKDMLLSVDAAYLQKYSSQYSHLSIPEIQVMMLGQEFMNVCYSRTYDTEGLKEEKVRERNEIISNNGDIFFPYKAKFEDGDYDQIDHFNPFKGYGYRWICSKNLQSSGVSFPHGGGVSGYVDDIPYNDFVDEVYEEALQQFYPGGEPDNKLLVWNRALELLRWKYQSSIDKGEGEINEKDAYQIDQTGRYIVLNYFYDKI